MELSTFEVFQRGVTRKFSFQIKYTLFQKAQQNIQYFSNT